MTNYIQHMQNELELYFCPATKEDLDPHDCPMVFNIFCFRGDVLFIRKVRGGFALCGRIKSPYRYQLKPLESRKMFDIFLEDNDLKLVKNFFRAHVLKMLECYNEISDSESLYELY